MLGQEVLLRVCVWLARVVQRGTVKAGSISEINVNPCYLHFSDRGTGQSTKYVNDVIDSAEECQVRCQGN